MMMSSVHIQIDINIDDEDRKYGYHRISPIIFVMLVSYIPLKPIRLSRKLRKMRFDCPYKISNKQILENSSMVVSNITNNSYCLSGLFSRETLEVDLFGESILRRMNHGVQGVFNYFEYEGNKTFIFDFNSKIHFTLSIEKAQVTTLKQIYKANYSIENTGNLYLVIQSISGLGDLCVLSRTNSTS